MRIPMWYNAFWVIYEKIHLNITTKNKGKNYGKQT